MFETAGRPFPCLEVPALLQYGSLALCRRAVLRSLALLLASILMIAPGHAVEAVCALDATLQEADFENSGGQTADVDNIAKTIRVRAEGGAAGSENSAHGELGFRFQATTTMPALITLSGVKAQGRLEGFGNINAGSITIRAIVRDLTTGIELGNAVVLDKSQNGEPFTKIIEPVNELFLAQPQFEVTLTEGHEYAAFVRADVKANGLLGLSDFHDGGGKVTVGAAVIAPTLADLDGDGLLDVWETSGIDLDCDASNGIDLDLPAMGANPNHKDLFLEIDWLPGAEPSRADIQVIKEAFAAAPKDSGGIANPDNADGISFRVDTGDLIDGTAAEDGGAPNTCSDGADNGADNGADGLADASDPDCLVGDIAFSSLVGGANLGDGRALPAANISDLETDSDGDGVTQFYEARAGNFRPERRLAFRYAISGPLVGKLGGQAEFHGNDFVFFKPPQTQNCSSGNGFFPAGTHAAMLMHELGHTLGLRHGGDTDTPQLEANYVSIMNYALGFGIKQVNNATSQDFNLDGVPDCRIFDFSPPRRPAGRGAAPLPSLNEQNLDETKRLDPTDSANLSVRFDPVLGQWVDMRLDQRTNWDGDNAPNEIGSQANINNDKDDANPPAPILSTALKGWDDWKNLLLSLRGIEDSEDGPKHNLEVASGKDDADEMLNLYRQTSETDLEIAKAVQSAFLVAGQPLTYRLTVTNKGPNRSLGGKVVDDLPGEAKLLAAPANCATSPRRQSDLRYPRARPWGERHRGYPVAASSRPRLQGRAVHADRQQGDGDGPGGRSKSWKQHRLARIRHSVRSLRILRQVRVRRRGSVARRSFEPRPLRRLGERPQSQRRDRAFLQEARHRLSAGRAAPGSRGAHRRRFTRLRPGAEDGVRGDSKTCREGSFPRCTCGGLPGHPESAQPRRDGHPYRDHPTDQSPCRAGAGAEAGGQGT